MANCRAYRAVSLLVTLEIISSNLQRMRRGRRPRRCVRVSTLPTMSLSCVSFIRASPPLMCAYGSRVIGDSKPVLYCTVVENHHVEVKVQPFAYQTGHFFWSLLRSSWLPKALSRGCLRPTSESLTLGTDQRQPLLWQNEAEAASTATRRPLRPYTGRACSKKVWAWGAPPVGSYRRRLPLPDCFPCSTPRPLAASSLTTRPAPSAHRAAHQEVLRCSR